MNLFFRRTAAGMTLALSLSSAAFAQHYKQANLVADAAGAAEAADPQLVNAWGLARLSGGPWWVSNEGSGVSTIYNGAGAKQTLVVTIPKNDPNNTAIPHGLPTGIIANGSTTDFMIPPGQPAVFLFSTLDGSIAGWNPQVGLAQGQAPPSTNAVTVVHTTDGSGYTGLASAYAAGKRYLYAANFLKGRIDVFDSTFAPVTLTSNNPVVDPFFGNLNQPFTDDSLPPDFVPYNVQAIGNDIVVTYAMHVAGNTFETPGPGLGYVDIYSSTGTLLRRLEHGDWLNGPWGVALAPLDFGRFSHALLVANFAAGGTTQSAGYISAYDLTTGKFLGVLENEAGQPLAINGIWALSFANGATANSYDPTAAPASELYFTAGPNGGANGLFGYLVPVSTELVEGSSQ